MLPTRRAFIAGAAAAAAGSALPAWPAATETRTATGSHTAATTGARWPRSRAERAWLGLPDRSRGRRGLSSVGSPGATTTPSATSLATGTTAGGRATPLTRRAAGPGTIPDLRRRFVFEYYPWYDTDPWFHWNDADHSPPLDVTASSLPRLGPYDTNDLRVLEQHARWIADAGVGAINLSWWGRGDYTDLAVPRVMDVMRDHDIKVTFHLEPYRDTRARSYADDVLFLLREYGDKRRWDTFLLLDEGNGRVAPVFKSFRTILPSQVQDCLGRIFTVPDYTPDDDWRRQTEGVREATRRDFARVYLLADSLDVGRTAAGGFDGVAVYDNFVTPPQWARVAQDASDVGLLFSFNVNPGFDRYPDRTPPPPPAVDPCYGGPLPFEPGGTHPEWSDVQARSAAQDMALERVSESFRETTTLQQRPGTSNRDRGFFLAYVNSFNEWHEGSQFEPAADFADLTPEQRRIGYHNPPDGLARLRRLRSLIDGLVGDAVA